MCSVGRGSGLIQWVYLIRSSMRGSVHANVARPPAHVTGIKALSLKAVRYLSMLCCAENEVVSFK